MSTPPSQVHYMRSSMARSSPPPPYRISIPSLISHDTPSQTSSSSTSRIPSPSTFSLDRASEASTSRPSMRRSSSSSSRSSERSYSPSSIYPTPDPSTAPTTPSMYTPVTRSWRPTSNVPIQVHRRHRRRGSGEEEANRWLSEDEGLGSSAPGVRRRRSSGTSNPRHEDQNDRGGDAGPSTRAHRGGEGDKVQSTEDALNVINQSKRSDLRPRPNRARSFDPNSCFTQRKVSTETENTTSQSSAVGANPPQIEQLVPPPAHTDVHVGLGIRSVGSESIPLIPHVSPVDLANPSVYTQFGLVPDFATGRGGDGIGGINLPASSGVGGDLAVALSGLEKRKELVEKLRRVLGCALCPPVNGVTPTLHHPITLPCGHTLSSNHITIPAPPPLRLTNEPPHEIHAAQHRQHQQRLVIWSNVMCPVPTCKRYSPTASPSAVLSDASITGSEQLPVGSVGSNEAQRSGIINPGVTYYPPAPPLPAPPPAYSPEAPDNEYNSPLLDICVDKILDLVNREKALIESEDTQPNQTEDEDTDIDSSSGSDEEIPFSSQASLTQNFSHLASSRSLLQASTSMGRTGSKRRRRDHRTSRRMPRTALDQSSVHINESGFEKELLGTLECDVCAMLLFEPVTTPCQHSFCSKCLSRSLDHSSRCPVCRQDLPSFAFMQDHAVNKVLLTILKTAFPDEYIERQQAIERDERDARLDTPIFVCTLAFPGMPTILHVFEPRYRLMIRRCIESPSPRFGMLLPARGVGAPQLQGVMEYGTMLEIQSVQMLPDGRSMVETVGTHRFKLLETGNLDGYTVGRIERIDDVSPEEEIAMEREAVARATLSRAKAATSTSDPTHANVTTVSDSSDATTSTASASAPAPAPPPPVSSTPIGLSMGGLGGGMDFAALATQAASNPNAPSVTSVEDTPETTEELMAICQAFIDQLRSGSAPWLLQRLNNTYGSMPTDPSEFSYWMALVMPIDEYEKARLLPIRSPRLRLKLIVHWVESLRSSWW
ncbi:uncharacterized protein IL334_003052 [Kwoniella shivajii]|uniref:RING-type domain-containing protein n=1 Tax=Kwoniella shivajii TaxID=564305 RepID=A0ABZ1CWF7_9TREE|nr:hypothetical protein IL334_003052 [Kwoniella shivajii]